MHTVLIVGLMIFFLFSGQAFPQPVAKHLIDAKPPEASLYDVEKWFQDHPREQGNRRFDTVFLSPRGQVVFFQGTGTLARRHIHSQIDEFIYVYKGRGELYLNGKWTPIKAGQFHTCPRGVAHGVRTAENEEMYVLVFYSDPLPSTGDWVWIDE
jgi:quercetin dioxygenase-like cupin family protein